MNKTNNLYKVFVTKRENSDINDAGQKVLKSKAKRKGKKRGKIYINTKNT